MPAFKLKKDSFSQARSRLALMLPFSWRKIPSATLSEILYSPPNLNWRKSPSAYGEIRNADHLHFMLHPSLACFPCPLFSHLPTCIILFLSRMLGNFWSALSWSGGGVWIWIKFCLPSSPPFLRFIMSRYWDAFVYTWIFYRGRTLKIKIFVPENFRWKKEKREKKKVLL